MKPDINDQQVWQLIRTNPVARNQITSQDFDWFFHLYFGHYITYQTADFHRELMQLVSDPVIEHLVVMAFRDSGKSTIVTTSFPLWAVMGNLQKKYVLIVSQTQNQAQQHLKNIAMELASNDLLTKDFMPYEIEDTELGVSAINLPKFGARIIAVSREQSLRGLRFGPHRPDLIIADDVEDTNMVKTSEGRKKNFDWFTGELIPLGSEKTKYITIGNLLHDDSMLMRLKRGIASGERSGHFVEYPLAVDDISLWPSRFPDPAAIKAQERRVGNPITWQREYMLRLVPDDDQLVTRGMIHYYKTRPEPLVGEYHQRVIGVDLALKDGKRNDCNAFVVLDIYGRGKDAIFYIRSHPFNKHMNYTDVKPILIRQYYDLGEPRMYIEDVAFQGIVPQEFRQEGYNAVGVVPRGDKRERLSMIADRIQQGKILFPEYGCEELITQLVGFGIENHDDLVDALTLAILQYSKEDHEQPTIRIVHDPHLRRLLNGGYRR